jgi:hypothetical protein
VQSRTIAVIHSIDTLNRSDLDVRHRHHTLQLEIFSPFWHAQKAREIFSQTARATETRQTKQMAPDQEAVGIIRGQVDSGGRRAEGAGSLGGRGDKSCLPLPVFLGLQGILTSRGLRPGPTLEPCPWFDTNVCAVYATHVKSE